MIDLTLCRGASSACNLKTKVKTYYSLPFEGIEKIYFFCGLPVYLFIYLFTQYSSWSMKIVFKVPYK